jgi:Holliday junction resolvase
MRLTPASLAPLAAGLLVAAALTAGGPADAGPRKKDETGVGEPAANAGDIPQLASLLARAGWEPTPELSGAFRAGHVFRRSQLGHRLVLNDCFTAAIQENTYTEAAMVTSLQAGVSVGVRGMGNSVEAGLVKKIKFGTPVHMAIPQLKLVPTDECRSTLARATNIDDMYVVQEVLSATIAEQTCGFIDGQGKFLSGVASVSTELQQACSQASLEPVSVGYRTVPLREILGMGTVGTTGGGITQGGTQGGGSLGGGSGAFGDVNAVVAQIQAAEKLKGELERQLTDCLKTETAAVQAQAKADWATLEPLRSMARSNPEARKALVDKLQVFVEVYGAPEVSCRNDLGTRTAAVSVPELGQARSALSSAVSAPAPASSAVAGYGAYRIVVFTDPDRGDFDGDESATLSRLQGLGFQIQDRPGGGGTNTDANIKYGTGHEDAAKAVQKVMEAAYGPGFGLKEQFGADFTDLYVNLGPYADSAGGSGGGGAVAFRDYELYLFTEASRTAFDADEREAIGALKAIGFNPGAEPGPGGTNDSANVKYPAGGLGAAQAVKAVMEARYGGTFELIEQFPADQRYLFVNLGPHARGGGKGKAAAADVSRYNVVIFTQPGRGFTPAEQQLIGKLKAQGFQVRAEPGAGGTNPDANVKVGSDSAAVGKLVADVLSGHFGGGFALKPEFSAGDPDVFINLGPHAGGASAPVAALGGFTVTVFTEPSRSSFSPGERAVLRDLEALGFKVSTTPGGGGTNPDSNVKVAQGSGSVAAAVNQVIREHYGVDFPVIEQFSTGDTDVFVNLGPMVGREGGGGGVSAEYAAHEITLFTTAGSGSFSDRELALLRDLQAMGFQVDTTPGGGGTNDTANVKVAAGKTGVAAAVNAVIQRHYGATFPVLEQFSAGDPDVFINLGPHAGGGSSTKSSPAAAYGRYTVVIFTSPGRSSFSSGEQQLVRELQAMGFNVKTEPGGGGTNSDANVKVGSDSVAVGEAVRAVLGRRYGGGFTVKPEFSAGDTDVFINLGPNAGR